MIDKRHVLHMACEGVSAAAIMLGVSLCAPGSAVAQDHAASASPAGDPQVEEAGVADIVVTAQKRSERLQDVPVAVAAVTPETLSKASVDSTAALPSLVPGLTMNASPAAFRPFLRGVGTAAAAAGNENSVSTYIDNIYLTSMNAGLLNLASIESIEVLKGPQGTLFGRNATGGVINIRTKDPSVNFGGNGSISYGNYDAVIATGYVTGGLTDTLAADLAVYYRDQADGYGTNIATGNETNKDRTFTIRSKVQFKPTDADVLTLAADYTRQRGSGQTFRNFPGTVIGIPSSTNTLPITEPYVFRGGTWDIDNAIDPFVKSWFAGVSLTYTHDFGWASLSSFTAYRKSRVRYAWNSTPIPVNAFYASVNQPENQFSQELQLSSLPGSKVKWIAGFYYLDAAVKFDPFVITGLALAPNQQQFRMRQTIKSPALYGQFTVPVEALGDTNITGGLRYTIDKRAINGRIEIVAQSDPATVLTTANPTDASKTFKTFTWRLGVDHHFTPDVMAYLTYNRGFKAGSYNSIPPGGPLAQPTNPEYLDAYELGMKNTLFNGRATLNIAAFLYKYRDLQVTIFNNTAATTVNAAAAEIKGLDIDFNARLTDGLRILLGAEFLDHKFTSYKNGPILTPLTAAQGGGVVRTFGDLSGNRLPYASDMVLNAGIFYEQPTPVGEFDASVNFTWNDGYTFEPSEVVRQKSFENLNATMGFTLPNGTTRFSAFGRNLTNSAVARTFGSGANPGGYLTVQYNPPRTYGLTISQKF